VTLAGDYAEKSYKDFRYPLVNSFFYTCLTSKFFISELLFVQECRKFV